MNKFKNSKFYNWMTLHPIISMIAQLVLAEALMLGIERFIYWIMVFEEEVLGFNFDFLNYHQYLSVSEFMGWLYAFIVALILGYKNLYKKPIISLETRWLVILPLVLYITYIFVLNWFYCMYEYTCVRLPITEGIFCAIAYFLVGLFEEFTCRGLYLNICLKHLPKNTKGMWIALILSSSIFGGGHIWNYINGGAFLGVLYQIIFATGIGILLGAIYIRTGSLLLVSFLHGAYDFALSLESGFFKYIDFYETFSDTSWISIIPAIPCIIIGIIILRKGYACVEGVEIESYNMKLFSKHTRILYAFFVICFTSFILYYTGLNGPERRTILINMFGY